MKKRRKKTQEEINRGIIYNTEFSKYIGVIKRIKRYYCWAGLYPVCFEWNKTEGIEGWVIWGLMRNIGIDVCNSNDQNPNLLRIM